MDRFLEGLQVVAGHPLALIAYVAVVAAWVFTIYYQGKLRTLSKLIRDVPEEKRAELIQRELSTQPRAGLSANQWLQLRSRHLLLTAFIVTLVVLLLIVALALHRGTNPPELPDAELSLEVEPQNLEGSEVLKTTVSAEILNTGQTIAEDVAVQIVTGPGIVLTDDLFQGSTVHLESLPGKISTTVEWDVEINPFQASEIVVRMSARNAESKSLTIPVTGAERIQYESVPLAYRGQAMELLPDGTLAVLDSANRRIECLDTSGRQQQSIELPKQCSDPERMVVDSHRNLIWLPCTGSSAVAALSIADGTRISIPPFPIVKDNDGVPLSRTPLSVTATPDLIACTSTDDEQCLWLLDWPASEDRPAEAWRPLTFPFDLTWTDFRIAWAASSERLMMLHTNVLPSSISFFNPSAPERNRFATLSGHDYTHVGGASTAVPLPHRDALLVDQYGEYLNLIATDGSRLRRARMTPDEEWTDGIEKKTLIGMDQSANRIVAAVIVESAIIEVLSTNLFSTSIESFDSIKRLATWRQCRAVDVVVVDDDQAFVLCDVVHDNQESNSEIRKVSLN